MQKKGMNVPKVSEPNADDFAGALPQEFVNAPDFENQPPPIEKVVEAMFFVGGQPLHHKGRVKFYGAWISKNLLSSLGA